MDALNGRTRILEFPSVEALRKQITRTRVGAFWKRLSFRARPLCRRYFILLLGCSCYFTMAAVKALNPKAEVARAQAALAVNISAARGLQDVLRSNLGPKGTMKM